MGYARAGFGGGVIDLLRQVSKPTATTTTKLPAPTAPSPATVTVTTGVPATAQPIQPIQPILVAGPAPSPSDGGGGGGGGDTGLAPATGGTGVSALLQQPAVLIGLAILGFLALRRGGGTRRF